MKKSSRRALSHLLAGVMLVSSIFSTTFVNATVLYDSDELRCCNSLDEITTCSAIAGDADMSGQLTANDAASVLAYVLNPAFADSDYYDFRGCDVDNSGEITAADASMIVHKVLNSEYIFPVETTTETTTVLTTEETTTVSTTETTTEETTTESTTEATTEVPTIGSLDDLLTDTVKWGVGTYTANSDLGNGLTFLLDVAPMTDGAGLFAAADGSAYEYSKAAEANNCMSAAANGDMIKFTAPSDGTFTIAFKVNNGKTGTVFGETVTAIDASAYYVRTYNVTAGQSYTAGLLGSKLRIFYMGYTPAGSTEITTETTTEAVNNDSYYNFDDNPEVIKDGTSGITYTVTTKDGTVSDCLTAIASIVNGVLFLNDASSTDTVKATLPLTEKTSGTVTYTAKITPSVASANWTIVQLNGVKADDREGEVLGVRTDASKNYGIRVNAGTAITSTTAASAANAQAELVITVDFDNDTATFSVNGSAPVTVTGVDAKSITSMSFQTAVAARDLEVDDAGITR